MTETSVIWQGNMAFEGITDGQYQVPLDAGAPLGKGEGFKPMQLMAIGLAGCTAMDVIAILRKKRQEITAFAVRVQAEQASQHPHVFTRIKIEYSITGNNVQESAVQRAIDLSESTYCPAQAMMKQVAPIELTYTIHQAEPEPVA